MVSLAWQRWLVPHTAYLRDASRNRCYQNSTVQTSTPEVFTSEGQKSSLARCLGHHERHSTSARSRLDNGSERDDRRILDIPPKTWMAGVKELYIPIQSFWESFSAQFSPTFSWSKGWVHYFLNLKIIILLRACFLSCSLDSFSGLAGQRFGAGAFASSSAKMLGTLGLFHSFFSNHF